MSVVEFFTGVCAMAALCALCDMLTPGSVVRKCTRTVISLYFLLFLIDGIMKLIKI